MDLTDPGIPVDCLKPETLAGCGQFLDKAIASKRLNGVPRGISSQGASGQLGHGTLIGRRKQNLLHLDQASRHTRSEKGHLSRHHPGGQGGILQTFTAVFAGKRDFEETGIPQLLEKLPGEHLHAFGIVVPI
jgi:hypothetical protein